MLEQISISTIEQLASLRLNLSHLWVLELLKDNYEIPKSDSASSLLQGLERKLFVVDGKITPSGVEFYNNCVEGKQTGPNNKPIEDKNLAYFEEFWATFPKNDTFEYKGRSFQGSRALKTGKKDEMKAKFDRIIAEGEVSATQLINALKVEIGQKKEMSIKTGQNKLSFMSAMPAWFNKRNYIGFIDITVPKQEEGLISNPSTSVDI